MITEVIIIIKLNNKFILKEIIGENNIRNNFKKYNSPIPFTKHEKHKFQEVN